MVAMYFNIRKLRKNKNLTQQDIADVLKVPQSSVSAMEIGKTNVSEKYIEILENTYNIKKEDYMEEDRRSFVYLRNARGNQVGEMENSSFQYDDCKPNKEVQQILVGLNDKAELRIEKLEKDLDELRKENKKLIDENTKLKILLAKNSIEFDI